jgi:hypothetical protein
MYFPVSVTVLNVALGTDGVFGSALLTKCSDAERSTAE